MRKKQLAVLFGGCSSEYPVSLQSAYGVLTHLRPDRYEAVPVGITREGKWLWYHGQLDRIPTDTWWRDGSCTPVALSPVRGQELLEFREDGVRQSHLDGVFPVLHGRNGEDGTVQGLIELAGIPLVGCGTLSSALCMDKELAHTLAGAAGVPVPPSAVIWNWMDWKRVTALASRLRYPLFVKPARAGSSFGIARIVEESQLEKAVSAAFSHDEKVLLEEEIPGFEVGCAVLGRGENLFVGAVDEIELKADFFNYREKYGMGESAIHVPARIDQGTTERIKAAAARVYRALDCRGFARVDLFLTPSGQVVFNEVNTIPGMTPHSRFPGMLAAAGLEFSQALDRILEEGLG